MLISCDELATQRLHRCGFVPFSFDSNGQLHFALGKNCPYGELNDFGGGIKKFETPISSSLRELREESNGVFSQLVTLDTLYELERIAFVCGNIGVIFVKVPHSLVVQSPTLFQSVTPKGRKRKEVSEIKIVTEKYFESMIFPSYYVTYEEKLWRRVQRLFQEIEREQKSSICDLLRDRFFPYQEMEENHDDR